MASTSAEELRALVQSSVEKLLREGKTLDINNCLPEDTDFDVFLSHSYMDYEAIHCLKLKLEASGLRVYVDWFDLELDRSRVTGATADRLKARMRHSEMLIYAISEHAMCSRWTNWELGYYDGINGNIVIFPISKNGEKAFEGQEYLSLYPYLTDVDKILEHYHLIRTNKSI